MCMDFRKDFSKNHCLQQIRDFSHGIPNIVGPIAHKAGTIPFPYFNGFELYGSCMGVVVGWSRGQCLGIPGEIPKYQTVKKNRNIPRNLQQDTLNRPLNLSI